MLSSKIANHGKEVKKKMSSTNKILGLLVLVVVAVLAFWMINREEVDEIVDEAPEVTQEPEEVVDETPEVIQEFGEVRIVEVFADYDNNALSIEGEVTEDVEQVTVSALRWIDEQEYEDYTSGHRAFVLDVENGSFSQTLTQGEPWPGGDSWHGLRPGTHQIRIEVIENGEVVDFMDSNEFFVEEN